MKSDDILRSYKRGNVTVVVVSPDVSGEEALACVIAETLTLKPWLGPSDEDLEKYEERREAVLAARYERRNSKRRAFHKSICPVVGCGRRKRRSEDVCYQHRKKPEAASNPFISLGDL